MNEEQQKRLIACVEALKESTSQEDAQLTVYELQEPDSVGIQATRNGYLFLCSRILEAVLHPPQPTEEEVLLDIDISDMTPIISWDTLNITRFALIPEPLPMTVDVPSTGQPDSSRRLKDVVGKSLVLLGCALVGAALLITFVAGIIAIVNWFRR